MNPLGAGGGTSNQLVNYLLSLLLFFVFIYIFNYLFFVKGILRKLERFGRDLENMVDKSKKALIDSLGLREEGDIERKINRMLDFFLIPPVDLDPVGILRKLEHIWTQGEDRFNAFVEDIVPEDDPERKANLSMALRATWSLYAIYKLYRHYLEMFKKTKNFQFLFAMQMMIPQLRKIAKGYLESTKAFAKGIPIGDSIGPMVASELMKNCSENIEIARDTIVGKITLDGRELFVIKPKGPGGRLGKLGDAVVKICSSNDIRAIITVDAALKLEGEETGVVSEGVGVAIGGFGATEKAKIENLATRKKIDLRAVIIKMDLNEALEPMNQRIAFAVNRAIESIRRIIEEYPEGSKIIVVGVGNSCGIGNGIG